MARFDLYLFPTCFAEVGVSRGKAMIELANLWVPLALLGLIILAALFFSWAS
ncbi:hypothetical protein MC7420_427 [Coleofasciculus chthonoplastes PCC 7420]|uniref:Uncharacterized protein n=1 Tax=Coleofasciculus chthonoplastes PCC 7420 TaxID=118168 RepID=B4VL10_9CYAN|nr:hypothetical protein MC7420_427 [Coleofasciculus chthonoplastes PCC 7420]